MDHFPDYHLNEILLEAVFSPRIAISPEIRRIDLGYFGLLSEKMIQRTLKDSLGRERGRSVLLNNKGNLTIRHFDTLGAFADDGRLLLQISLKLDTRSEYQSKKPCRRTNLLAGIIHTHGHYDLPASPLDFYTLFGHPDTPSLAPMIMVVTPERKSLYFRSPNTPQWPSSDLSDQIIYWDNWLNRKRDEIISHRMSKTEKTGRTALLNYSFIKELRNNFDIRCFSCLLPRNIAIEDSA